MCQINGGGDDVEANVAAALALVDEAATGGAELVMLPELFAYYGSQRRMRELAEPFGGPITGRLAEAARERSIWLLGGSVCESVEGRVYNTSYLFDRRDDAVARYRKITFAPSRANSRAVAAPIPVPPPVINATLFSSRISTASFSFSGT